MKIGEDVLEIQKKGYSRRTYSDYLKTGHWLAIKKKKLRQTRFMCEECGGKERLQVHHKRYKNNKGKSILYNERMRDLIVLCENCHKRIHLLEV
jgi:predicted HNH restriction endonuclease